MRSIVPRRVSVGVGGDILWEGVVPAGAVSVELPARTLAPGTTALAFSTDAPGVAESPGAGARRLGFAVYNFQIR